MAQIFKSPLEQSNDIVDSDNRKLDITSQIDSFFAKYPKKADELFEDYDERVYSPFANEFGTWLNNDALTNIYERALKKSYFGDDIDDDYERSYGPVDNADKYAAYLKWKNKN